VCAAGRIFGGQGRRFQFHFGCDLDRSGNGFYGVQNIGTTLTAVNVPSNTSATLYRVTAVGITGTSRSVVESVYAKY
jgi:hypothetical protein